MISKFASRALLCTVGLAGASGYAYQCKDKKLPHVSSEQKAFADRLNYLANRFHTYLANHQIHARGAPPPPPPVPEAPKLPEVEDAEEIKPFSYIDVPPSCYPCPPCKNLRTGIKQSDLQYCTELSNIEPTRNSQFYASMIAGIGCLVFGLYPSLKHTKAVESKFLLRLNDLSMKNRFIILLGGVVTLYGWYWKSRATEKVYFCPREDTFIYQTTKPTQMFFNLLKNEKAGQCEHNYHAVPQFTVQRVGRDYIKKMKEVVKNNPEGWAPSSIKVGNDTIYISGHDLSPSMKCLLYAPGEEEENNTEEECFSVEPVAPSFKFIPPPVDKADME